MDVNANGSGKFAYLIQSGLSHAVILELKFDFSFFLRSSGDDVSGRS